jgi:hypothetical protein
MKDQEFLVSLYMIVNTMAMISIMIIVTMLWWKISDLERKVRASELMPPARVVPEEEPKAEAPLPKVQPKDIDEDTF